MAAYVKCHFKAVPFPVLLQNGTAKQKMPVQMRLKVLLLKAVRIAHAAAAEHAGDIASPENLVAPFPPDFRRRAHSKYLPRPFIHINQFISFYIRNIYNLVDILKKTPQIAHKDALLWYLSGTALLWWSVYHIAAKKSTFLISTLRNK